MQLDEGLTVFKSTGDNSDFKAIRGCGEMTDDSPAEVATLYLPYRLYRNDFLNTRKQIPNRRDDKVGYANCFFSQKTAIEAEMFHS